VSLIDRVRGVSSEEIWSYPNRRLTERFGIIERSRGLSAPTGSLLVKERRAIREGTRFILATSSGSGFIALQSEDLIRPATTTYIASFDIPGAEKDWNDNTCMRTAFGSPAPRTSLIKYDLGSLFPSLTLAIYSRSYYGYVRLYVAVSPDDVTYTDIISAVTQSTTATWHIRTGLNVRYVRLDADNPGSSDYIYFCTVEAYPTTTDRTFTSLAEGTLVIGVEGNKYYHLLEVIQL
jgi:hypothetical protein